MINLDNNKDYYILIDGQGGTFGGGRIFDGLSEVIKQFRSWADSDEYKDPTLTGWTIGNLIENLIIDIKKYNGKEFIELTEAELNYKISNNNMILIQYKENNTIEGYVENREQFNDWLSKHNADRKLIGEVEEEEHEFNLINIMKL